MGSVVSDVDHGLSDSAKCLFLGLPIDGKTRLSAQTFQRRAYGFRNFNNYRLRHLWLSLR
jgi:hypothetical protein